MSIFSSVGNFFALDIGVSGARLVKLRNGKSRQLSSYGSIDYEPNLQDTLTDDQMVAISDLIRRSKVGTDDVAISAPPNRTFITVADTPIVSGDDLSEVIKSRADQLIPKSADQVQMGWAALGPSAKGRNQQEVLVATVDITFAESRIEQLSSMGYRVVAIEPEPLALSRALTPMNPDQNQGVAEVVLEMGYNRIDLVVVSNGNPRLVRSLGSGMSNVVRSVAQTLSVNEEQASQLVYKVGLDKSKFDGRVYQSMISTIVGVGDEVDKSIKFHKNKYPDTKISKVVVTGQLSLVPQLPQYFADRFMMNVEIGNSWLNIGFPEASYDTLASQSEKFGVAAGLSLRTE